MRATSVTAQESRLVVIDGTTGECLAIEVIRSFPARDVIGVLQYLFAVRGTPQHVRSDNGPEFVTKTVRRWLQRADVGTLLFAKGSPWDNGYVESAGRTLRRKGYRTRSTFSVVLPRVGSALDGGESRDETSYPRERTFFQ
ncbi:MAG: hypothetical protein CMJ81_14590 [Planctomycetaceae bacterium]|nr:hypothetical protein [Planctomycetaceae bacterium]MBP60894.1 hypothetical protein [Planctomycetaceae bacterium]